MAGVSEDASERSGIYSIRGKAGNKKITSLGRKISAVFPEAISDGGDVSGKGITCGLIGMVIGQSETLLDFGETVSECGNFETSTSSLEAESHDWRTPPDQGDFEELGGTHFNSKRSITLALEIGEIVAPDSTSTKSPDESTRRRRPSDFGDFLGFPSNCC